MNIEFEASKGWVDRGGLVATNSNTSRLLYAVT